MPLSQWRTLTNSVSERYSSLRVQSTTSPVRMAKRHSAKSLCQAAEHARIVDIALVGTKPYR